LPASLDRNTRTPPQPTLAAATAHGRRSCRSDLAASVGDGAMASMMVGTGETYLPAFALAAGLGEVASGLVSTVPLLMGAVLQLAGPMAMRRVGSYRRWVVMCVVVQATSFLPLVIAAARGTVRPPLVFLTAAVYWGAGLASSPAWNTWMGTLVPPRIRAHYFARRTRISQACVLAAFVGSGFALQWGSTVESTLGIFAMLFLAASICRFVSSVFLSCQNEATADVHEHRTVSLGELFGRMRHGTDGSLLLYFLAVQCAAQISGPYFNPYLLQHLKFSYLDYVTLIGAALAGRVVAMPLLGRVAGRYGARTLLWIGGVGIVPMSAAWCLSDGYWYLLGLQLVVGFTWGAYELAVALLFFEAIDERERHSLLTKYNFAHATCTVIGSLVGGMALTGLGKSPAVYMGVFVCSSVARAAVLVLLWRVPKAPAEPEHPVTFPFTPASEENEALAA
jgi:MFS family permease